MVAWSCLWLFLLIVCTQWSRSESYIGQVVSVSGQSGNNQWISNNPPSYRSPYAISYDTKTGYVWVTDPFFHTVRRINPDGTTIAIGNGAGPVSIDGSGTTVRLLSPQGIIADPNTGNVYFTQKTDGLIRVISPELVVTTIAGSQSGYQDGVGSNAKFNDPRSITYNNNTGTLYVTDFNNNRIRAIDVASGNVTTFAGSGAGATIDGLGTSAALFSPFGICISNTGILYVTTIGTSNFFVREITPNGNTTTFLGTGSPALLDGVGTYAKLSNPAGCVVEDDANLLWIVDSVYVRRVDIPARNITTYTGGYSSANGPLQSAGIIGALFITVDPVSTFLYVTDGADSEIRGIYGAAPPASTVLVASTVTSKRITITWQPPTLPPTTNVFYLKFDNNTGGSNFQLVYTGTATTYTATGLTPNTNGYSFQIMAGNLLGNSSWSSVFTFSTNPAGVPVNVPTPIAATVYTHSIVFTLPYPADDSGSPVTSYRVQMNDGTGYADVWIGNATSTTVSGLKPMTFYTFQVFATNSFGESLPSVELPLFTAGILCTMTIDPNYGGPQGINGLTYEPISNSLFVSNIATVHPSQVFQIFMDGSKKLYGTGAYSHKDGVGSTARFTTPEGAVADRLGGVYVTDRAQCVIRKIVGDSVTTLAGIPGTCAIKDGNFTSATFTYPTYLALDNTGNFLYVADGANIRKISIYGNNVSTVAGTGAQTYVNGYGTYAGFQVIYGLAVDQSGNVFIADNNALSVKVLYPSGEVRTAFGDWSQPSTTRQGYGTSGLFSATYGIAYDNTTGKMYIADGQWIRQVGPNNFLGSVAGRNAPNYFYVDGESLAVGILGGAYNPVVAQPGFLYYSDLNQAYRIRMLYSSVSPPPYNFQAQISADRLDLTWFPAVGYCAVANYTLEVDGGSGYTVVYQGAAAAFSITGLTPGTAYNVKAQACNYFGCGDYSAASQFTTLAAGPPIWNGVPSMQGHATLFSVYVVWPAAISNGSPITSYSLQIDDGTYGYNFSTVYTGLNLSCNATSLLPLKWYQVRVIATNAAGSTTSAVSDVATSAYIDALDLPYAVPWNNPTGMTFDQAGNLWVCDQNNNKIIRIGSDGTYMVVGNGVCTSIDGNLTQAQTCAPVVIIADTLDPTSVIFTEVVHPGFAVRRISSNGTVSTIIKTSSYSGNYVYPHAIVMDSHGTLYYSNTEYTGAVFSVDLSTMGTYAGAVITSSFFFGGDQNRWADDYGTYAGIYGNMNDLSFDSNQTYMWASGYNSVKRVRMSDQFVQTWAGNEQGGPSYIDGVGTNAVFAYITGIKVDAIGGLIIADGNGNERPGTFRRISPKQQVTSIFWSGYPYCLASGICAPYGTKYIAVDSHGFVWITYDSFLSIMVHQKYPPPLPPVPQGTGNYSQAVISWTPNLVYPAVYVLDMDDGLGGPFTTLYTGKTSRNFVVNAYDGNTTHINTTLQPLRTYNFRLATSNIFGLSYSALVPYTVSPSTGTLALTNVTGTPSITGAAVDSLGNIYVTDATTSVIYKVQSLVNGNSTVFASEPFSGPTGIVVDFTNNRLIVADTDNCVIRAVSYEGNVTLVAGQVGVCTFVDGVNGTFSYPQGVAIDSVGNIIVADTNNNAIRVIFFDDGVVLTLAGNGSVGQANGDSASSTTFNNPTAVAIDSNGNIYVSDTGNNVVRQLHVDYLGGKKKRSSFVLNTFGAASFNSPRGILVQQGSANILFVADSGNNVIKQIDIATGIVTIVSGSGSQGQADGFATGTSYNSPFVLAQGLYGDVIIADANLNLRYLDSLGSAVPIAEYTCGVNTAIITGPPLKPLHSGLWTLTSGSGNIGDPFSAQTTVTNLGSSANVFRWTITYLQASGSSYVTITIGVPPAPAVITQPASASFGTCLPTVPLQAQTLDSNTVGQWASVSGNTILFSPNATSTSANVSLGVNVISWTTVNPNPSGMGCSSLTSSVTITRFVPDVPTTASIVGNSTICTSGTILNGSTPATGSGLWTTTSNATIVSPTSTTTAVTGLPLGPSTFTWTVTSSCAITSASVTVHRSVVDNCGVCAGDNSTCPPICGDGFLDPREDCEPAGVCCNSSCLFSGPDVTCHNSSAVCDLPEFCTGMSASCPTDIFANSSTICRPSAGICDKAENCTGSQPGCPIDSFYNSTTVCRPAVDLCDMAEYCNGTYANCSADAVQPSTYVCRNATDLCDISEYCTFNNVTCPADHYQNSSYVCRPAQSGVCDLPSICTGSTTNCPPDTILNPQPCDGGVCNATIGVCICANSTLQYPNCGVPVVLSCTSVPTAGGIILITGYSFGYDPSAITVFIANIGICTIVGLLGDTNFTCSVPAGSVRSPQQITIGLNGFNSTDPDFLFTYSDPVVYNTTAVPTSGGWTTVSGSSFGTDPTLISLYVGGILCTNITVFSDSKFAGWVPRGLGDQSVRLTITDYLSDNVTETYSNLFSYAGPKITNVTPPRTAGGTIEIYGANFGNIAGLIQVSMDNGMCTNVAIVTDDVAITCDAPRGSGVQHSITVVIANNTVATPLEYAAPVVTSVIVPRDVGLVGGDVTILGDNFGDNSSSVSMYIQGANCTTLTVVNDTTLICQLPPGTGIKRFNITVNGEFLTADAEQIAIVKYNPPNITHASPIPLQGARVITINGINFGNDISTISVTVRINPITNISCTVLSIYLPYTGVICSVASNYELAYTDSLQIVMLVDTQFSNAFNLGIINNINLAPTRLDIADGAVPLAVIYGAIIITTVFAPAPVLGVVYAQLGMVNNVQNIAALQLVSVDYPDWMTSALGKFSWVNFYFAPPWESSFPGSNNRQSRQLQSIEQYAENAKTEVENIFPTNLFVFIIAAVSVIVLFWAAYFSILIFLRFKQTKAVINIRDNLWLKKWMAVILPPQLAFLGLCCSSTVYMSYGNAYQQTPSQRAVWAFAFLVFIFYCVGYPVFWYFFLRRKDRDWFANEDNTKRLGFLWLDFKGTPWGCRFMLFQLLRKLLHGFWTGFLRTSPKAQVAMLTITNLGYFVLLILLRPYKSKLQGVIEVIACFLITLDYLLCYGLLPDTSLATEYSVSVGIAVLSIAVVVAHFSTIVYKVLLVSLKVKKAVPKLVQGATEKVTAKVRNSTMAYRTWRQSKRAPTSMDVELNVNNPEVNEFSPLS